MIYTEVKADINIDLNIVQVKCKCIWNSKIVTSS